MSTAEDSVKNEGYQEVVVSVTRTAKVVKGGRVFRFSALVVVGNGKGSFGYGRGKAGEVQVAIQKAIEQARKNMFYVPLCGNTIYHELTCEFGASKIFMKPASDGTGIIAGGAMRAVFEVVGIQNILAKSIGSSNPGNIVRAVAKAFAKIATPDYIAAKRGKTVAEITAG